MLGWLYGEFRFEASQSAVPVRRMAEDAADGADQMADGADTDAGAPASDQRQTPVALFRDWLLLVPLLGVIALDQATKYVVKSNLDLYEAWPAEGFFRIAYRTNSGSAFGLFPGQTVTLIFLSLFAIGFLFYFYRTRALSYPLLRLAIGLQLGGAVGNLIDRLRHGAVVDFIDVGPWPTFNVADSSIVVGIFLLAVMLAFSGAAKDDEGKAAKEAGTT